MNWLRRLWLALAGPVQPPREAAPEQAQSRVGFFSTDVLPPAVPQSEWRDWFATMGARVFQRSAAHFKPVQSGVGMDADMFNTPSLKQAYSIGAYGVPDVLVSWYGTQTFIGYQMCAILAQHWLIDKACSMPAKDATRGGYEVTANEGDKIAPEVLAEIERMDKLFSVIYNTQEMVRHCRIYGVRIVLYVVDGADYELPFNIDGVRPGTYRGMSQVDPYWITPELDYRAASDPSSVHFYEPTFWRINGKRYHRSWLHITRTCDVPDVLKPTYFFGGIPVPQRIYERVYAAERTANEGPQLALTKRTGILKVDMAAATATPGNLERALQKFALLRDNYGTKTIDKNNEDYTQFDTTLADVDVVIMTQYQLVAAIAEVPATKLLGTMPKGFNATGEYEEASYHEFLESIQTHNCTPMIERHHLLLKKSYICPKFNIPMFDTTIVWHELDAETAKEAADRRLIESQAAKNYADTGALDAYDIRDGLIANKDSGYNGIERAERPDGEGPNLEPPAPPTGMEDPNGPQTSAG